MSDAGLQATCGGFFLFVCFHFLDMFKSSVLLVLFLRVSVSDFYHRQVLIPTPHDLVLKKNYQSNGGGINRRYIL